MRLTSKSNLDNDEGGDGSDVDFDLFDGDDFDDDGAEMVDEVDDGLKEEEQEKRPAKRPINRIINRLLALNSSISAKQRAWTMSEDIGVARKL